MSIETTIHLQTEAVDKLSEASNNTGYSKSALIVLLMERAITEWPKRIKSFERLRYQERDPEQKWTRIHVWLREDEYEYALDLRKLFKFSFSGIIAVAIEKFLDKIIIDLLCPEKANEDDKYRVKNYILVPDPIDDILTWRFCWGIPINLSDIIPTDEK